MRERGQVTIELEALEAVDVAEQANPLVVGQLRRLREAVDRVVQLRDAEAYAWGEGRETSCRG